MQGKEIEDMSSGNIVESGVEFDNSEVVTPDNDLSQMEAETTSVLKGGEIIRIRSARDLKVKLDAASTNSRLAIIYFTAKWCDPCHYISPVCSRLAKKYPEVVFLKADIDEAMDAAAEWDVRSIPLFFYVKNGKEVDKIDRDLDKLVRVNNNPLEQKIVQHAG